MSAARVFVISITFVSVIATSQSTCVREPGPPYSHYTELGCKPIFANDGCIERYDCPFMKTPLSPEKCALGNSIFSIGQSVPRNRTAANCRELCSCEGYEGIRAFFICAAMECPEFFPHPDAPKDCVKQYSFDSCCSVNEVCDQKEKDALKTCTWDSQKYMEGQFFYPEGKCKRCLCSKDFDGTISAPWCRDTNCGVEFRDGPQVHMKCAPIYPQIINCCAYQWKCFTEADTIVRAAVKSADPQMKCQYGDQLLDVGDKISGEDKCIVCSCDIPPLAICTRLADCE